MKFLKKNKIVVIVIVVVLILAVVGGGYFLMHQSSSDGSAAAPADQTQNVKDVKPEDIGLDLSLVQNKQAVEMKVTKLDGIKSLEYELSYNATEVTDDGDGETADVPKGALSSSPIDVAGKSEITRDILLGTCSTKVCRYDKVSSDIKVMVKINYSNGEVGSVNAVLPFK
ncbi:MAG TPA: hypothetical protein VG965_03245 [Patescibacteria group bacterium]|nr:hypothetical protein [Patescibacteria group bacterium]